MSPDVAIYTQPPAELETLLRTHHLPYALPLLRRMRFTRFLGGITEHARILFASGSSSSSSSSVQLTADFPGDAPFAAAYLDLSRGPETQMWLYSSLERRPDALVFAASSSAPLGREGERRNERDKETAARCARRVLAEVRRQRDAYYAGREKEEEKQSSSTILAGTLSETLRLALLNQGLVFASVSVFDKWIFRLDSLPEVSSPLAADMRWEAVRRGDIPLMLSRTKIRRTERTIVLLRSMAVYRDDDTPIAWALLGPDSSLSSLHCEEEWRGRGFAKVVAVKILKDCLKDYDDDVHCWADVAPDNPQSQAVCRSLGGKVAWIVSWSWIDLDKSFPGQ
ncbi:hypothetical protein M426DRAFT_106293 [Hypoxylon sp. CI-4A]|nr:hypothetical protein M426DRAFT_106293 [Hypoxylon sp. CI-4A]